MSTTLSPAGFNNSDVLPPPSPINSSDVVLFRWHNFYVPIFISLIGGIGNLATFLTIILTDLRQNYVNAYVCVLLASDSLLLLKISSERIFNWGAIDFWSCVGGQYFWNLPIYISNLTIVLLTFERFFAVLHPFCHMKFSYFGRGCIISLMVAFAILFNFNVLVPIERVANPKMGWKCRYNHIKRPFSYALFVVPRLIFTFLLPLFTVIFVNVQILIKLRTKPKIQRNVGRNVPSSSSEGNSKNTILWFIPISYVVLNFPNNVYLTCSAFFGLKNKLLELITIYIFIVNYSINFILYAMASKKFRHAFVSLWFINCKKKLDGPTSNSVSASGTSAKSKETSL